MFLILNKNQDRKVQNTQPQFPRSTKTPENGLVTLADLLVLLHTKESPSDPVHTAKPFILDIAKNCLLPKIYIYKS